MQYLCKILYNQKKNYRCCSFCNPSLEGANQVLSKRKHSSSVFSTTLVSSYLDVIFLFKKKYIFYFFKISIKICLQLGVAHNGCRGSLAQRSNATISKTCMDCPQLIATACPRVPSFTGKIIFKFF